ncbi:MAG: alkene reductase [Pseudomonadota bacterium]|nr:alkene reductase [Pseudomonadota bacterium]
MPLTSLFQPLRLGRHQLAHRVVMPPLTRMRAGAGAVPNALAPEYYGQRATPGGLIIAEGTQISPSGQGYPGTPGIHSQAQIDGWKAVTEAVHAKGGIIFLQLWHTGRSSHSSFQPDGALPVAPSAIPITTQKVFTADWQQVPYETPRALEIPEIAAIIEDYRQAARNAMEAGFDGVELHAANGYLIEQFLHARSNHRDDAYGGSIENRARLLHEATEALIDVWGADRVGVRLSPFGEYNDVGEEDPIALYGPALTRLAGHGLAYLSLIEARDGAGMEIGTPRTLEDLRPFWPGVLIAAGGFDGPSADAAIAAGRADAVAFGRHFIANPDLPARLKQGAPLNAYERKTFYGGGAAGYVDYPALEQTTAV